MKRHKMQEPCLLIIATFVVILNVHGFKRLSSNERCVSDGFFRDRNDCQKFYRCVLPGWSGNMGHKYAFSCPPGTAFDESISVCNYADAVEQGRPCGTSQDISEYEKPQNTYNPENSEDLEKPEKPKKPEKPVITEMPEKPKKPDKPVIQEMPEKQENPETIENPGNPDEPDDTPHDRPRRLSVEDPNSFSNPEDVRAENIKITWDVDFKKTILVGSVLYNLVASKPGVERIIFDMRSLAIHDVKDAFGNGLSFEIGESYKSMGEPLIVDLPRFVADSNGIYRTSIVIEYETSPQSTALQWLAKEMTAERKFPFLYSQSEAIHARSLFPCQDTPFTKFTYSAAVTAPREATVLLSALSTGEPVEVADSKRLHNFIQKVPVPSYLVAIAVGQLESAVIGPRTKVWAEKSVLADAAFDFSEAEQMIRAAESIVGKYVWGRYDILVLPPSFPFGGMENPCLTFVTPSLLTRDKSLANVIAHEIAHSWHGNLVTNANFEHFWLNEGFTVFLERKILGIMKGEQERQFASIQGWTILEETVKTIGKESQLTKLVLDLRGVDPDDTYSPIPYEKGYVFLYYLEQKVGGAVAMNGFLRHYVDTFKSKSIDVSDFKNNFIQYFESQGKGDLIKDVDWDSWFYKGGMPDYKPMYDTTLYDESNSLGSRWLNWDENTPNPFLTSDLIEFSAGQIQTFLQTLLSSNMTLSIGKLEALEKTYGFNSYRNAEIRVRWLRLGIKGRWREQLPRALSFVTQVGRLSYIVPIYQDLYNWAEARVQAINTFKINRPYMMYISARKVAQILKIE